MHTGNGNKPRGCRGPRGFLQNHEDRLDAALNVIRQHIIRTAAGDVSEALATATSEGLFIEVGDTSFHLKPLGEVQNPKEHDIKKMAVGLGVGEAFVDDLINRDVSLDVAKKEIIREAARRAGIPVLADTELSDIGPITAAELHHYLLDPLKPAEPDQRYYLGFQDAGDLSIWLGEEKHRKSNMVLQYAVCAAIGRAFLNFRCDCKPLRIVLIDYETSSDEMNRRREAIITAIDEAWNLTDEEELLLCKNLRIIEVRRIERAGRIFPKFPYPAQRQAGDEARTAFWQELVALYPADVYILDPLRKFHSGPENDSQLESLLSEIRRVFRAAVIAPHHMRKASEDGTGTRTRSLMKDMRAWSDNCRGTTAFKAHVDRIVCQERIMADNGDEVIHFGVFGKTGADISPFALLESDHESFYFVPDTKVPELLVKAYDALKAARGPFDTKADAANAIVAKLFVNRSTAYRKVDDLMRHYLLISKDEGELHLAGPGGYRPLAMEIIGKGVGTVGTGKGKWG